MKEYLQKTLIGKGITDEEIYEARNDDELGRMRRDGLMCELKNICK